MSWTVAQTVTIEKDRGEWVFLDEEFERDVTALRANLPYDGEIAINRGERTQLLDDGESGAGARQVDRADLGQQLPEEELHDNAERDGDQNGRQHRNPGDERHLAHELLALKRPAKHRPETVSGQREQGAEVVGDRPQRRGNRDHGHRCLPLSSSMLLGSTSPQGCEPGHHAQRAPTKRSHG
jgi:hypothetical protein